MENLVRFALGDAYAIDAPHIRDFGVGSVTTNCVATHLAVEINTVYVGSSMRSCM
jgi:hypothetical protein